MPGDNSALSSYDPNLAMGQTRSSFQFVESSARQTSTDNHPDKLMSNKGAAEHTAASSRVLLKPKTRRPAAPNTNDGFDADTFVDRMGSGSPPRIGGQTTVRKLHFGENATPKTGTKTAAPPYPKHEVSEEARRCFREGADLSMTLTRPAEEWDEEFKAFAAGKPF